MRELTRAGRTIPLSPMAFRLLTVLAEQRPRVVAQAELRKMLWPDALVGGTRLARLVNEVRAAVGDEARAGRLIRTVHRFGYAFSGTALEAAPAVPRRPGSCGLEWGVRLLPLTLGENIIGRATDATISLASSRVSRRHARIVVSDEAATLEDLGSKNGTYLRGHRIDAPRGLAHGDPIGIGPVTLVFKITGSEDTHSSEPGD